jgi:hypothetical protein
MLARLGGRVPWAELCGGNYIEILLLNFIFRVKWSHSPNVLLSGNLESPFPRLVPKNVLWNLGRPAASAM